MKAVATWVIVCTALLLLGVALRPVPTSYQGLAIFSGFIVANVGMIAYVTCKK